MSPTMHSLLLAALGSLAVATSSTTLKSTTTKSSSAAAPKSTVYSISQVAEFDNISSAPGVAAGTVGSNSIYQLLKYNGFSLAETEASDGQGIPGVQPQSVPNFIAFSQGDLQTIDEGTPTITANYQDSSIPSFTLKSFYYGCVLGTELSLASDPISCTITVQGYGPPSSGSKLLATQSFEFVSNSGLAQDMTKGTFSSAFTDLYSAVFTLLSAQTNLTAGLVDNVAQTVLSNSPVVVN